MVVAEVCKDRQSEDINANNNNVVEVCQEAPSAAPPSLGVVSLVAAAVAAVAAAGSVAATPAALVRSCSRVPCEGVAAMPIWVLVEVVA